MKKDLTREEAVRAFQAAFEFVKNCQIEVRKPRVSSIQKYSNSPVEVKNKNMYLYPQVVLKKGSKLIRIAGGRFLMVYKGSLPDLVEKFLPKDVNPSCEYRHGTRFGSYYGDDRITRIKVDDLVDTYKENQDIKRIGKVFDQELQRIRDNPLQIWREVSVDVVDKKRKQFRQKFATFLKDCENLMELDPESICKVMQTGLQEVQLFASFVKRNKSDLNFLELEDVEEALRLAQVDKVMES